MSFFDLYTNNKTNQQDEMLIIMNSEIYNYYRERLINLALAQFEWHGLPETVDRRWLERTLLFTGRVLVYQPKGMDDTWLGTDFVNVGSTFDVYGYPVEVEGITAMGGRIETDTWEIIFDNMSYMGVQGGTPMNLTNVSCSLLPKIDLYARMLAQVHLTFMSNLQMQNTPYIIATNRAKNLTMKNVLNRVLGFQNVIEVKDDLELDKAIKTLDLKVEYKGTEMLATLKTLWAEALSMLGITAETTKKERMLADEITLDRQEDILSLNSRLLNRVDFCNKMNKDYGWGVSVNLSSEDPSLKPFGDYTMQMLDDMALKKTTINNYNSGGED